jgi:hypothetical protein
LLGQFVARLRFQVGEIERAGIAAGDTVIPSLAEASVAFVRALQQAQGFTLSLPDEFSPKVPVENSPL